MFQTTNQMEYVMVYCSGTNRCWNISWDIGYRDVWNQRHMGLGYCHPTLAMGISAIFVARLKKVNLVTSS